MEDTDSVNLSTFQATIPNERDMSITYGGSDVTGLKELTIILVHDRVAMEHTLDICRRCSLGLLS